jgi:hypothetical protein
LLDHPPIQTASSLVRSRVINGVWGWLPCCIGPSTHGTACSSSPPAILFPVSVRCGHKICAWRLSCRKFRQAKKIPCHWPRQQYKTTAAGHGAGRIIQMLPCVSRSNCVSPNVYASSVWCSAPESRRRYRHKINHTHANHFLLDH